MASPSAYLGSMQLATYSYNSTVLHDQFSRWGALLHIYTGNNNVTAFYDEHLQFPNHPEIQHNH